MINVYEGNNTIYLTLSETQVLTTPNSLFRFVHRTTGEELAFVKKNTDDVSAYKSRYNQFVLKDSDFSSVGQYVYYIYEQTSTSNTDPEKATLIETGICQVHYTPITYTTHKKTNTYVTR